MHGYEDGGDGPDKGDDGMGTGTSSAVPLHFRLLPQVLQSAGYRTLMIGKWHLGYPTAQHTPEARGFNEYLGYLTGAEDYYTHVKVPGACSNGRLGLLLPPSLTVDSLLQCPSAARRWTSGAAPPTPTAPSR